MLDQNLLEHFITQSLAEDVGDGDHTSLACIPSDSVTTGQLLVKDVGVICGMEVARKVFEMLDPKAEIDVLIEDGTDVEEGDVGFRIKCNTQAFLKGERLVLNTMQRLSGICTMSSRFAVEVEDLPVKILDTRKTTPGMRFLEKYAVKQGGCHNYRVGLYDWIMIKDNHVDACGNINKAITQVNDYLNRIGKELKITVEVRNLIELYDVLDCGGIDRIMFDNFGTKLLKEGVETVSGAYETEASGGINLQTVRKYALTGVDYISVGALTHSAQSLDLSLKITK
jgi:nicotinate-nucleotide pyrophosphorylase (carboxylating)